MLGKIRIGWIGIPKQVRREIFDTLPPRGVCNRILRFRLFAAMAPQSFHASSFQVEYFNLLVKECQGVTVSNFTEPDARRLDADTSDCGRSSGKKSILRALASFAAVRKEKLTSWFSTFVMYGRDTFMRRASSVCDTPSSFILCSIRRRNTDPILSTDFINSLLLLRRYSAM